ncbi:MAG: RNA-guided endonuclease InsQ/TnpB family protein [Candidatus Hodarchaeales archaeon]|jgi:putative transposase
MLIIRTEQIWLKSHQTFSLLCHLSKNLYNESNYKVRQEFFKNKKWLRYDILYYSMKTSLNYQQLPAQTAQQVLKVLDRNWKSFFSAIKEWKKDKSKFNGKPRPPSYKPKNGEFILVFTNQQVKLKDNTLKFPKKVAFELRTRLPDKTDIREVRIIPKGIGYMVEIVYQKEISPKILDKDNKNNIIAIDLGVRNLITIVNNNGLKPFVIKGGVVKSINQYYNKERARIQSVYDHQGIKPGKAMQSLIIKRNRKIKDYFHKTSRKIIEYCAFHDIGTVVIGYNPDWKQKCYLGKRNTQNFVTIPYHRLIKQLEYKAEEQGITVLRQEESYSSKCSFLDNEPIKHHKKYLGRRITRGLFKSTTGTIINADVNGAYNILKKAFLNAIEADRIEDVGLHPSRWRLASATS